MKNITIIACIDENNGLGYKGKLLYRLPMDLAYFKHATKGHIVIMGRKTFESLGKPLKGRRNIVLTRSDFTAEGVEVYHSFDEMKEILESDEEKFIIGGASIYEQFIKKANRLIITHYYGEPKKADTFFPNINFRRLNKLCKKVSIWDNQGDYSIMEYYM